MGPGGAGGGAAGGNLANLIVQITSKGFDDLKTSLADIQTAVGAVVLAINKLGVQMQESLKRPVQEATQATDKLKESWGAVGSTINFALGAAQGVILGFVRSGLNASAMGQIFQLQMERLSLTIAGLFGPEIRKVMELVNRFTSWIQGLSQAQKENIVRWVEGAAAALAVGLVLPRVLAGVMALGAGIKALGAAITGSLASTGIGALLPLIGLVVQAMTAWLVGTEKGRSMLAQLWETLQKLSEAFSRLGKALHLDEMFAAFNDYLADSARLALATANAINQLAEAMGLLSKEQQKAQKPTQAQTFFDTLTLGPARRAAVGAARELGLLAPEKTGEEKKRDMLLPRAGGFESLEATYQRIARASVGALSPEEKAANNLEEINRQLAQGINVNVNNPRPEIAR
jgi:hypothetical protein